MFPHFLRFLLFALDARCPPCNSPRNSFSLCSQCRNFSRLSSPFCLFCESSLLGESSCHCVAKRDDNSKTVVFSFLEFNSIARDLLHSIKYQRKYRYLSLFEPLLPNHFPFFTKCPPTLIPVPLSRDRFCDRTFNQSEWLARQLSRKTGLAFNVNGFVKTRETQPQSSLSRKERRRNLDMAFSWVSRKPPPLSVCIIDDVYTTGETLRASAKALMQAGTKEIFAWTLFRKLI
jgi:ComF family protein